MHTVRRAVAYHTVSSAVAYHTNMLTQMMASTISTATTAITILSGLSSVGGEVNKGNVSLLWFETHCHYSGSRPTVKSQLMFEAAN